MTTFCTDDQARCQTVAAAVAAGCPLAANWVVAPTWPHQFGSTLVSMSESSRVEPTVVLTLNASVTASGVLSCEGRDVSISVPFAHPTATAAFSPLVMHDGYTTITHGLAARTADHLRLDAFGALECMTYIAHLHTWLTSGVICRVHRPPPRHFAYPHTLSTIFNASARSMYATRMPAYCST